jgi:hypothetical protein
MRDGIVANANVIVGMIKCDIVSDPEIGSHLSWTPKR